MHVYSIKAEEETALFGEQQSVLEGTVERLQEMVECATVLKLLDECRVLTGWEDEEGASFKPKGAKGAAEACELSAFRAKLELLRVKALTSVSTIVGFCRNISASVLER
jgi:hypothetical protein